MEKSSYAIKENQVGCGYCANEKTCAIRDSKVNKAKLGCPDWNHFSNVLETIKNGKES